MLARLKLIGIGRDCVRVCSVRTKENIASAHLCCHSYLVFVGRVGSVHIEDILSICLPAPKLPISFTFSLQFDDFTFRCSNEQKISLSLSQTAWLPYRATHRISSIIIMVCPMQYLFFMYTSVGTTWKKKGDFLERCWCVSKRRD